MNGRDTTANDVLTRSIGAVVIFICVIGMLVLGAVQRPEDPAAAKRWDAEKIRAQVRNDVARDIERRQIRETIVGNMPVECLGRVAAAIPEATPPDETAMMETVQRLCPQAMDDE
jgi:hypothetical protein